MERCSTFREEDQVVTTSRTHFSVPQHSRAVVTPPSPPELKLGSTFGCLGSSKQHRLNVDKTVENEDRICMDYVEIGKSDKALFVGLFDGHGGGGKASHFVQSHIRQMFEKCLEDLYLEDIV